MTFLHFAYIVICFDTAKTAGSECNKCCEELLQAVFSWCLCFSDFALPQLLTLETLKFLNIYAFQDYDRFRTFLSPTHLLKFATISAFVIFFPLFIEVL
jgi:hypothetical protein